VVSSLPPNSIGFVPPDVSGVYRALDAQHGFPPGAGDQADAFKAITIGAVPIAHEVTCGNSGRIAPKIRQILICDRDSLHERNGTKNLAH
jgi:hypothetical protein